MTLRLQARRPVMVALSFLLATSLVACGDKNGSANEHNAQDIEFAQSMIPHHQQAIEMADLVESRAVDLRVKRLAERIRVAQHPEIVEMNNWLDAWGQPDKEHSETGSQHMHSGSGMMTEAQMNDLERAKGPSFERMFLEMMIEHHEGAIEMAKIESEDGQAEDAKAMAKSIISSQEAEIKEMKEMKGLLDL